MDRLPSAEVKRPPAYMHALLYETCEMHLDATVFLIVEGAMPKSPKIEIAIQFPINPQQQIEVELRRDAGAVVVGGRENFPILDKIDADDEQRAAPQNPRHVTHQRIRFVGLEIPQRRTRKEADARAISQRSRQPEGAGEVGLDR